MSSEESDYESGCSEIIDINYNEDVAFAEMNEDPELERKLKENDNRLKRRWGQIIKRYSNVDNLQNGRSVCIIPRDEGVEMVVDGNVLRLPTVTVMTRSIQWTNSQTGARGSETDTEISYVSPTEVLQLVLKNPCGTFLSAKQVNQLRDRSEDDLFHGGERLIPGMGMRKFTDMSELAAYLSVLETSYKFWFE